MSSTRLNLRFLFLQFLFFSLSQSPTAFLTISASTPTATTSPTHLNHQTIFSYYEQNYNRDTTRIVHVKFNAYPTRSMTNTWTVCTIDTGKIFPRTMRCENVYTYAYICCMLQKKAFHKFPQVCKIENIRQVFSLSISHFGNYQYQYIMFHTITERY